MGLSTKQYLSQIQRLDRMIQNRTINMLELEHAAQGIGIVADDMERVNKTSSQDSMCKMVAMLVDMEKETESMIDKRNLIVKQIESIEDVEMYDVLAQRYILGKPFKIIALDKGIAVRHMFRLHDKAIEIFEERYGATYM